MTDLITQDNTPANLPQLELEIKFYLGQTAQNIIEVGKRLIQAKSLVQHGHWQAWLEQNFQLGRHMAEKFMKVAERFSKMSFESHFGQTQLITLLALPSAEETEKFIEQKAAEGKKVAEMTIKELREEIAKRHNLTFTTVDYQFDDRSDVRLWIAKNQFGRRDFSAYERSVIALQLKPDIAKKAKENQGERTDLTSVRNLTNVDTKKEVAKLAGVSHDTIAKVEKIEKQATPEVKVAVKSGEISINEGYTQVKRAEKENDF